MRKRQYRARVWLNEFEYNQFTMNVEKTGLSKETYLRQLINGYRPRESPPLEYYEFIRQIMAIANNLNQIAVKANAIHLVDGDKYHKLYDRFIELLLAIQAGIER